MSEQRQYSKPGWLTLLRDVASYAGGWLIILKQAGILFEPPAHLQIELIVLAGTLIGVPQVAWLISGKRLGDDTGSSSPRSPAPVSPQPQPSSPSIGPGES